MASDSQFRRVYHQKNPENLRLLDAGIWKACAGTSVQIPSVYSRVYYFPQGHVEHCSSPRGISLSPIATSRPTIPCRVLEVQHLADPETDEVYAKIRLEPIRAGFLNPEPSALGESSGNGNGVVSFAKVLTPSDANNGGGFSVPRFCADSIFPKLDFTADPPVQNVRISDVHGEVWEFRHIFRGTPRRHLLTTGWSKFVNSKKLIAGDSVVFMKSKATEELFVGVRRAVKSNDLAAGWAKHYATGGGPTSGGGGSTTGFGFSRSGKGRVPAEAVEEAVERAASNMVFEVVYYPRLGLPDFVVAAEKVEASLRTCWSVDDKVKMAMETEDSSRMTWFTGKITSIVVPDHGPWRGSLWRSLQVEWNDTEILQHMKRVSPWQVEYDGSAPPITAFPAAKRLRASISSESVGEGDVLYPSMGWNPLINQLNSSHLNYNIFPAGMQGARHNPFFVPNVPNIMGDGARQTCPTDHLENVAHNGVTDLNIGSPSSDKPSSDGQSSAQLCGPDTSRQNSRNLSKKAGIMGDGARQTCPTDHLESVAHNGVTDLNIGSPSSDKPSPDGQSSAQLCGPDTSRQNSHNLSKKAGITSFQLFGKTIQMEPSLADDMNRAEYDCKTGVAKSITSSVVEAFAL